MMNDKQARLMDYYKAIEASSHQMLEAARSQDLEAMMRLEGVCAVLIEQLRHRALDEELTPEQRGEKTRIMQRILHNDAEIRMLTEPWLDDLELMLDTGPRVLH